MSVAEFLISKGHGSPTHAGRLAAQLRQFGYDSPAALAALPETELAETLSLVQVRGQSGAPALVVSGEVGGRR